MSEGRWCDAALEQAPGVVWAFDRRGLITAFNRGARVAARAAFGREPTIGAPIVDFVNPANREGFEASVARCLAGEELVHERSLTYPNGLAAAYELHYRPIRGREGEVIGVMLGAIDVSARLRLESRIEQVARLETATVLAGGLAHDLRNMLGVVQIELDLLQENLGPRAEDLTQAQQALDRGIELVRRLLQFAGREPGERVRVELRRAIEGAMPVLKTVAGRRASVVAELSDGLPVEVDALQLERVLVNLVHNACDALAEPRPIVIRTYEVHGGEAGWNELEPDRRYAVIAVRDRGAGMPESVRARVFEPFFTTKERGRGTGLGLAACWGIVRQHGGTMRVESAPGEGTTMLIALPRASEASPLPATIRDATVLTVDDDEYILSAISRTLKRRGASFLGASTPSEAISLARADRWIDVAVVDLILGYESGLSLARELRRLRPGLPLLVISGDSDALEEAESFGFPALPKPFGPDQFVAAVEAVLARRTT